jgi:hypothetical protein
MIRLLVVLAAAVVLCLSFGASAQDPTLPIEPNGGAAGGNALVLNGWDIRGPRNLQGGWLTNDPESLNFDIGAGSTANPGDLVLNYDVGRRTLIYDGHKHLVASFGPGGIVFYRRPRVVGGWRW